MAASGIAEHNEARRREMVYLRKAYMQRQYQAGHAAGQAAQQASSSYERQLSQTQKLPRKDPAQVDRERREEHYRQAAAEYSAKLPNRYTSINYMSQW